MKEKLDLGFIRKGIASAQERNQKAASDAVNAQAEGEKLELLLREANDLQANIADGHRSFDVAVGALESLLGDPARDAAFERLANVLSRNDNRSKEYLTDLAVIEFGRKNKAQAIAALRRRFIEAPEANLARFAEQHRGILSPGE